MSYDITARELNNLDIERADKTKIETTDRLESLIDGIPVSNLKHYQEDEEFYDGGSWND